MGIFSEHRTQSIFSRLFTILVGFFLSINLLHAQLYQTIETKIIDPHFFSRIGTSEWASGGVRTVEPGSPTAVFDNPALLYSDSYSIYTEFGKRSETSYNAPGINVDGEYLLPNTITAAGTIDCIHVGLGYARIYERYIHFTAPITTETQPDGTGEYASYRSTYRVHAVAGSAVYSVDSTISIGLSAGVTLATVDDELLSTRYSGNGFGLLVIAGMYARPVKIFHAGISVKYYSKISSSGTTTNNVVVFTSPPSPDNRYPFSATFPFTVSAGCKFDATDDISLMGEFDLVKWYNVDPATYNNTVNEHLGIRCRPVENVFVRVGYFTQLDPRIPYYAGSYDQQFWTAGTDWDITPHMTVRFSTVQCFFSKTRIFGSYFRSSQILDQDLLLTGIQYNF